MSYKVRVEQFEGPLDLLLNLIEEQKLDITQVSLAHITDQYLAYIREQEQISLENLADFLSVAAKLILIKSKALLPLLQMEGEEEADMQELEAQLAALKVIKDAIPLFAQAISEAQGQYARKNMWGMSVQFCPPENITPADMERAFLASLNAIPQLDALEEKIITDVVSLEKRITQVQVLVAERAEVAFSQIVKESKDTSEVVVSFLALLELVKQKIINVQQEYAFQDIIMRSDSSKQ